MKTVFHFRKAFLAVACAGVFFGLLATPPLANAQMWTSANFYGGVRGFNQPYDYSLSSYQAAAAYGANVIRFFIDNRTAAGGLSNNGSQYRIGNGAYGTFDLTALDGMLANAQSAGLKVILVIDDGKVLFAPSGSGFNSASLQNSFVAMWQALATHYKAGTTYANTIAGYDLWNEPVGYNGNSLGNGPWIPLSQTTTSAIRVIDPDHVIIWEPANWGLPYGFDGITTMPLASYGNIVYSYHAYDPHLFTANGVGNPYGVMYPNPSLACFSGGTPLNWNASTLGPNGLNCDGSGRQTILDLQAKYNFPIYVGEFSAYTASVTNGEGDPSATDWVRDSIVYFESKGFSWTYHSWRECYCWDAEITQAEAVRIMNGGSGINRTSTAPTITVLKQYFAKNKVQSPNGAQATPGSGTLTDASGNAWTVTAAGVVQKNGANAGSSANVVMILWYNGNIYQTNSASGNPPSGWWEWLGTSWSSQLPGDPRG